VIPSPEFQLDFLTKLQRLFSEGDFQSTYKFALLISLSDLAVEMGYKDDRATQIPMDLIGMKFIQLYWQQAAPYSGQTLLLQNLGAQAAVVNAIAAFRRKHPGVTLISALNPNDFEDLLRVVKRTVRDQPVRYLQNLGGTTDQFLFQVDRQGITLMPGVGYCLRRFQPLIQQISRSRWIDHIKDNRRNFHLVRPDSDLEAFLFETPRQALSIVAKGLRKISPRCHYCRHSMTDADVDHFIPRSLYPRDLIHNFVLAHPACNRSKSDTLASKRHLLNWFEYKEMNRDALSEVGHAAGILGDFNSTDAVARWGYESAVNGGAQAWIQARQYEQIDETYLAAWSGRLILTPGRCPPQERTASPST